MKRFRFPLDALLALRRRKLQGREAALAKLQARRAETLERAGKLERQSAATRASLDSGAPLQGANLRLASAACEAMLLGARAGRQAAARLQPEINEARRGVLETRREVETLDRMRERSLDEWRRAADREQEAIAAELFLARFSKGDNDDR
jgi:flagellar export protein FliJ